MRPVNLIPSEDRRGQDAPGRTGPLPYLLVGVLVAALVGVTALVLIGNQISDRKSEITRLEQEDAAAKARAEKLAAYSQFRTMHEQRVLTVSKLADSRFDWERVMRELSLVLPRNVWLTNLIASASAEASVAESSSGSGGTDLRASIPGPALQLTGCATSHDAVAAFVTTLKDIDGVTRVAVESSELPESGEGAASATGGKGESKVTSDDCRTRNFIAEFHVVVAFDAAPLPITAGTEPAPISATEKSEAAASETAKEGTEGQEKGPEGG